jgi:exopolysaccharide biosynthesis polyprenyl glycosylphosphotransferase
MLVAADVGGLVTAFVIAELVSPRGASGEVSVGGEFVAFLAVLPAWVLIAKLNGLYDRDEERADHSTADDLVGVFNTISIATWVFVVLAALTDLAEVNLPKIMLFWALAVVLVSIGRAVARTICRRRQAYVQRTLVVGGGTVGHLVARKILTHPEYGLELVGFVDASPVAPDLDVAHVPVVGEPNELPELIGRLDADRVVFAFSTEPHASVLTALRACRDLQVQCDIVPRYFEMVGPAAGFHALGGLSLVSLGPAGLPRSSQWVKRLVDLVISVTALVLLAPLLALIALLVKLDSPGPAFFRQTRMGADDRPFRIYKFRTMVADAELRKTAIGCLNHYAVNGGDARMFKAKDDPRTTRVGRILRRFALDELPQLVNVLKGEMSIVGPRPLILDEDQHIADWGRRRLALKPGMTGPWQVLGRNDIPFPEMVTIDYLYVTNWSLMGDIVLMFRTIPAIIRPGSVY